MQPQELLLGLVGEDWRLSAAFELVVCRRDSMLAVKFGFGLQPVELHNIFTCCGRRAGGAGNRLLSWHCGIRGRQHRPDRSRKCSVVFLRLCYFCSKAFFLSDGAGCVGAVASLFARHFRVERSLRLVPKRIAPLSPLCCLRLELHLFRRKYFAPRNRCLAKQRTHTKQEHSGCGTQQPCAMRCTYFCHSRCLTTHKARAV